jgi:hypothetical protein
MGLPVPSRTAPSQLPQGTMKCWPFTSRRVLEHCPGPTKFQEVGDDDITKRSVRVGFWPDLKSLITGARLTIRFELRGASAARRLLAAKWSEKSPTESTVRVAGVANTGNAAKGVKSKKAFRSFIIFYHLS